MLVLNLRLEVREGTYEFFKEGWIPYLEWIRWASRHMGAVIVSANILSVDTLSECEGIEDYEANGEAGEGS
jgi:hypothetical protein